MFSKEADWWAFEKEGKEGGGVFYEGLPLPPPLQRKKKVKLAIP